MSNRPKNPNYDRKVRTSRSGDLTGQRFHIITVLNRIETKTKSGRVGKAAWECICDCGKTFIATTRDLLQRDRVSCGCQRYKKFLKVGEAGKKNLMCKYVRRAKLKSIEFSLTYDEFASLISSNCHYCGALPRKTVQYVLKMHPEETISYNGIDRKDSSLGYTSKNSDKLLLYMQLRKTHAYSRYVY